MHALASTGTLNIKTLSEPSQDIAVAFQNFIDTTLVMIMRMVMMKIVIMIMMQAGYDWGYELGGF